MLTMLALSLCLTAYPDDAPVDASRSTASDYSSMTREQLLRVRARVADERPGAFRIAMAWLGIVLGGGGGISSFVTGLAFSSGGVSSTGVLLMSVGLVGIAAMVTSIVWLAVAHPMRERARLGNELDIIDDMLDNMRRAALKPSTNGLTTLATF